MKSIITWISYVAVTILVLERIIVSNAFLMSPSACRRVRLQYEHPVNVVGRGWRCHSTKGSTPSPGLALYMNTNHNKDSKSSQLDSTPVLSLCAAFSIVAASTLLSITSPLAAWALSPGDGGASAAWNAKITTGGASTLQSGRTIAITRGVNLDNSNFKGQNLKGVAFQQSIVRDTDFRGANLVGSSFFDATVDGSDFEGADMTLANVEMAQFNRANLKNTIVREMYLSGSTLLQGIRSIEGSDWTDTMLRKDQQKYLCNHPTATGTNPVTGVNTRESLLCPE